MGFRVLISLLCWTTFSLVFNADRAMAATIGGFVAVGDSVTSRDKLSNSWVPLLAETVGLDFGRAG